MGSGGVRRVRIAGVFGLLSALAARAAESQSGQWTATLTVQPFPSAFVADWERNPQTAVLTVLYTGSTPQDFRIEGFVRSTTRGELARVVSPPLGFGFGPVSQIFTSADLLEWHTVSKNQQYVDLVVRTGVMPEGALQMCARVLDPSNVELALTCADFTIALPDPPQLIFPSNGGMVAGLQPVFQWTPVLVPPELGVSYRVRVVERLTGQDPATALSANPMWHEAEVVGAPVLVYPLDALPLDSRKEYVWRVEALDADGNPLTRGGRSSEVWTFTLGGPGRAGGPLARLPDTLELVPGVARLTGLSSIEATETDFAYVLNGGARLQLLAPFAADVAVQAEDLELDKTSIQFGAVPSVRAGALSGSLPSGVVPPSIAGDALQFSSIAFSSDGLWLAGTLVLPGTTGVQLDGKARLTAAGLYGTLTADGTGGQPLLALGEDPARLVIRRARVTLPGGQLDLAGELEVFARDVGCGGVAARLTSAGLLEATVACTPTQPLALSGTAMRAQIALRSLSGTFSTALTGATATPQFSLNASGEFRLDAGSAGQPGAGCGASIALRIDNNGVAVPQFTPRCDAGEGDSDLGWLRARLSSLSLQRFAYAKGQGFDFALAVDLAPWLPSIPGFELPPLLGVTITAQGLGIPAIDITQTRPPFEVGGFGLTIRRVRLPAFTLSWSDWQLRSPEGFRFSFDADFTLPNLPGASCLTAQPISITGAELADGKLRATLVERRFSPACALTLTAPASGGTTTSGSGGGGSGGGAGGGDGTTTLYQPTQTGYTENACPFEVEINTMKYPVADEDKWRSTCPPTETEIVPPVPTEPPPAPWANDAARQADIDKLTALEDEFQKTFYLPTCDATCKEDLLKRLEAQRKIVWDQWRLRDMPWSFSSLERMKLAEQCAKDQQAKGSTLPKMELFKACYGPLDGLSLDDVAACASMERDRQMMGATTDPDAPEVNCITDDLIKRAEAVALGVIKLPPLDAPASEQRAFCSNVAPYGLSILVGAQRQREIAGFGSDSTNQLPVVAGVASYCGDVTLKQLDEVCKVTPVTPAARSQAEAIRVQMIARDRQSQMLGVSDDTKGIYDALQNCAAGQPPASAAGEDADGGGDGDGGSDGGGWSMPAGSYPDVWPEWRELGEPSLVGRVAAEESAAGLRLELERYGGQLVVGLYPFFQIERIPEIEGAIVLPQLFSCPDAAQQRQPLVTKLRLGSRGEVSGQVTGLVPDCTIDLDAVQLRVIMSSLTFSTGNGAQSAVLRVAAEAKFTLASSPVTGSGSIAVDLLRGQVLDGSLAFQGPLQLDLPRDKPVLSFTLQSASFDRNGIHADGRAELKIPDSPAIAVTFDQVTINPQTVALTSGRVLFDAPFAFQVGVGNDGAMTWGVQARGSPLTLQSGMRIDLPSVIALTPNGFTASGDGAARVVYGGRDVENLTVKFSPNFAMRFDPVGVAQGMVDFQRNGVSLAYIDAAGFHPNLAYFAAAILPARLPLPSADIAYLELRDQAGNLRVQTENTGQGIRIYTAPGASVPLVLPALKLGRPVQPQLDVTIDLTLDPLGEGVSLGSISATVPPASSAAFDLSDIGLPVAFESIAYERASGGSYRWSLGAALKLFGQQQGGGADKVLLALDNTGRLTGAVSLTPNQAIQLAPGSSQLTLKLNRITGAFDAILPTQDFQFQLTATGGLELAMASGTTYTASATLVVSENGLQVQNVAYGSAGGTDEPKYFDFTYVKVGLNHLRVPVLDYNKTTGFRFELLFDAYFQFPLLDNFALPPIENIALRNDGFTFPEYSAPQLNFTVPNLGGFAAKVLAFRMAEIKYNWFTGQGPVNWGFGFDLELGFGNLIAGAPASLQNARARVLNAGYSNGQFTGTLERLVFPQPLDLGIGKLFAISGALPQGNQPFALTAELSIDLAAALNVCSDAKITAPNTTIAIYGDGWIQGSINAIAPTCPGDLGPFKFQFGSTSLVFGYGTANGQRVRSLEVAAAATVKFPGLQEGDTVTASGNVRFDALQGKWIGGRIDVLQPFRYKSPDNNPYLAFEVSRASLDDAGLHFTGQGSLAAKDGAKISAQLNDLTIGIPDFRVKAGSVTFINQFALGVGIGQQGLEWGAIALNAPRPSGASFRAVVPDTVRIDPQGLYLGGTGSAELAYGDSTFASIQVRFIDGFRVGFSPLAVTGGRANFLRGPDEIAHIDQTGFWPGNLFAVLPVPARLSLPNDSVAYVELRDQQNALLIETQTSATGLQLRTKPNQAVKLVVPALQGTQATPPAVNVSFDIVVNPQSFQVISGFIKAETAPNSPDLLSLEGLGIPLSVRKIGFEKIDNVYGLRLAARFKLPESLNSLVVDIPDLTVTKNGIEGEVRMGSYIQPAPQTPQTLAQASFMNDTLRLLVTGAYLKFGQQSEFGLAGWLSSALFVKQGDPAAQIFWSGSVSTQGFVFQLDDTKNGAKLPLYIAEFEPKAIGQEPALRIAASAQEFSVRLSGILRLPTVNPDFRADIAGLQVGTRGVVFPTVSITGVDQSQEINLFGAKFALIDSTANGQPVYPALKIGPDNGALGLTMSGKITFLDNTARFYGLKINTKGEISLTAAKLLSQPFSVVENYLTVDSLNVKNNTMRADLSVTLPEPLNSSGPQRVFFTVDPAGHVSGGADLALINEQPGLNPESNFQLQMGDLATIHLRYLGLTLDFAALKQNSSVQVIADLYLKNEADNRIAWGDNDGGVVHPGLKIGFNGSVTFGNLTMPDSFAFNFGDVLKLGLSKVAFPPQQQGFAIAISGGIYLNVSAVSGFVEFEDFTITSQGNVIFTPNGIKGGGFAIADMVELKVTGFGFSATPTTLTIKGGGLPTGNQNASSTETQIEVSSYIKFGGEISISDVFSGGVDLFLLYKTGNYTHLLIQNAHVDIMDIVTFSADFKYDESEAGWEMILGGTGKIMGSFQITVVGALAQDTKTRFGIFVAVEGISIRIGPYVEIQGLGGGFFLNPKPEWIDYVRFKAGVAQTQGVTIETPPDASFAIMLFGVAGIVDSRLIKGKVLLTISDAFFRIDGYVTLLSQDGHFEGDIHVQVAFKKVSVQGNIGFKVDYGDAVKGGGYLDVFVFSADAWGVHGHAEVTVITIIKGGAELLIGPVGFYMHAFVTVNFNVWIISIDGLFEATVWFKDATGEFGAYVSMGVKASVLGGLATAEGRITGALLYANGTPYIFGVALLSVSCPVGSWEGWVWVKFQSGQLTSGMGQDPEMMAAIDHAKNIGNEMTDAKNETEAAIGQTKNTMPAAVALTDAELAAAYRNVQSWPKGWYDFIRFTLILNENTYPQYVQSNEGPYQAYYSDTLLKQRGIPGDSAYIANLTGAVGNVFTAIQNDRPQVEQRIAALGMSIQQLTPLTASQSSLGGNPVSNVSLALPVTRTETRTIDSIGTFTVDVVVSGGQTFRLDTAAALAQAGALNSIRQQADANDLKVREQIVALEDGLAKVRAATTTSDVAGLPSFLGRYADVASTAEHQFAAQADYILQRQDWMQASLANLRSRDAIVNAWVRGKTAAMTTASSSTTDSSVHYANLKAITRFRMQALVAFSGNSAILDQFDQTAATLNWRTGTAWMKQQADTSGRQIWYHMARVGMETSNAQSDAQWAALRGTADQRLTTIRTAHASLSQALGELYRVQAEATGALYDLYDRYLYWRSGQMSLAPAAPLGVTAELAAPLGLAGPTAPLGTGGLLDPTGGAITTSTLLNTSVLTQRRDALAQDLTVPRITSVTVSAVSTSRYTSEIQFTWNATHPRGVYEFLYLDADGANQTLGAPLYSNGTRGTLKSYRFTTNRLFSITQNRTFEVAARGGAGYAGLGRANYTLTFQGSQGATPTGVTTGGLLADVTPPSTPIVSYRGPLRERLNALGVNEIWTSDPTSVLAGWSAEDPESGVSEYEYALWGTATGFFSTGASSVIRPFTSVGGRDQVTIDHLSLTPANPLYVAVRAKNGQGLTSATGVSAALRYDGTPPAAAAGTTVTPWTPIKFTGVVLTYPEPAVATYAACPVAMPPLPGAPLTGITVPPLIGIWTGTLGTTPTGEPPKILFNLPALSDPESGVISYMYKVTLQPESTYATGGWTTFNPSSAVFLVEGAPLNYTGQFYLSVVAMNTAGLVSRPVVSGPFRVTDPTPPSNPEMCAGVGTTAGSASFTVLFSKQSTDAETQVSGYQYRIRTEAGAVVRNWPASGVDWSGTSASAQGTAAIALTGGQRYFVDVRAVNGHGQTSGYVASGPILYDNTPPPNPTPSIFALTAFPLEVTVVIPADPESGTQFLQWAVGTSAGATDVAGWQAVAVSGPTMTFNVPGPTAAYGATYWVQVRTVNGAGATSAVVSAASPPAQTTTVVMPKLR